MTQIHEWKGATGRRYCFQVHALPLARPPRKPGIYLFCRAASPGWEPVDVGQTENLAEELARPRAATHVHLHIRLAGFDARVEEEADLRAVLFP
jgi:hypothetical protein